MSTTTQETIEWGGECSFCNENPSSCPFRALEGEESAGCKSFTIPDWKTPVDLKTIIDIQTAWRNRRNDLRTELTTLWRKDIDYWLDALLNGDQKDMLIREIARMARNGKNSRELSTTVYSYNTAEYTCDDDEPYEPLERTNERKPYEETHKLGIRNWLMMFGYMTPMSTDLYTSGDLRSLNQLVEETHFLHELEACFGPPFKISTTKTPVKTSSDGKFTWWTVSIKLTFEV